MAYSLLKDVNDSVQDCRVRVRVCRFWEHRDDAKDSEILRMHLVLVDEKGDGIHGLIPKGLITRFQTKLQEGQVYYMQYMEIVPVVRPFRTTYHRFELRFTAWTNVTRIDPVPDTFPLYTYRLRSIKDITDTVTDKTYLADVVGLITGVCALTELDVKGKRTNKRNLRITDGRHNAILALWGDNAVQIDGDDLIKRSQWEPLILLAMGCTFKIQDAMLMLTASYGSKICINLANPDISSFRNRITGMDHSIEWISERLRRVATDEIEQTTVAYLASAIPHVIMNKVFRCKITVQAIVQNQTWRFRSCDQCSYKAVEDGAAYQCLNSNCVSKSASPRYKIPIIAADDNVTVEMVLFGDVGRDMVGRPADALLTTFLASNSPMPPEIMALVGRKYVVEVTVSRFSFRRDKDGLTYQVRKFFPEGGSMFHDFVPANVSSHAVPSDQPALLDEVTAENPNTVATDRDERPQSGSTPVKDVLENETQNEDFDTPSETKEDDPQRNNKRSRANSVKSTAAKKLALSGSDKGGRGVNNK